MPEASSGRSIPVLNPKSDGVSPVGDLVDAKAGGECVEVDVAGLVDRFIDIDCAVAGADPATLIGAEEVHAAGTVHGHVLGNVFFKPRERHDDLECGARSELRLDGLVHQRMFRIGDVFVPLAAADAHGKLIGIEGRAADESQHFAGMRIDGDHGAIAVAQSVFGGALDVEIDGEAEALSGFGGLSAKAADLAAMAVDDDIFRTVFAAQDAVVRGFDSGSADDVAGLIHGVARVVEHLFAHFANVADEVGGEAIAGVEAALLLDGVEFGQARPCAPR